MPLRDYLIETRVQWYTCKMKCAVPRVKSCVFAIFCKHEHYISNSVNTYYQARISDHCMFRQHL